MASKLESLPGRTKRTSKYPWDQYMNGEVWKLKHGDDFDCTVQSFVTNFYTLCSELGYKGTYRSLEEGVIAIQALPGENGVKPKPSKAKKAPAKAKKRAKAK